MSTYQDLQALHQQLLARREAGEDRLALRQAVHEYIEQARSQAHDIARPRDRDQLRANLRFWGTFLYDETGIYPDTALPPASHPTPDDSGKASGGNETSGLLRWAVGIGVAIFALLLLLLILVTRQRQTALPEAVATVLATHEELVQIQNAVETIVAAPTITPMPPTTTPTITPTPNPSDDIDYIVGLKLTEAARTEAAGALTATSPSIIIPPAKDGQESYERTALLASVSHSPNPGGCERATIQVNFDLDTAKLSGRPSERISSLAPQDFQVDIRPIGGSESQFASVEVKDSVAEMAAGRAASGTAYFVHVSQASVTASDVIVQFDATCNHNPIITYQWQTLYSGLPAEPERNASLDLSWELTTWGPAPQLTGQETTSWIATITLLATGANQNAIFWVYRGYQFEPLPDGRLIILSQAPCEPATAVVSVTSGGASVIREIVLVSPLCQKQTNTVPQHVVAACTPEATVQEDAMCRNGPGTVYDVVTAYKANQVLTLDGRNQPASWFWVRMPSSQRHCWMSAELLTISCGLEDLPVITAPPTPTGGPPTSTPTPTPGKPSTTGTVSPAG